MTTLEKQKSPPNSPAYRRRRERKVNIYPSSLPGSRSSSPGRNVMSKRAIFEDNSNSLSVHAGKKEAGFRDHSTFHDNDHVIPIEEVEEFDRVYNSAIKKNNSSINSYETKTCANTYVEKHFMHVESSNNARKIAATPESNIDRNARIIPDYVSAVTKIDLQERREGFTSEVVERRRPTKRPGRVDGSRSGRYRTIHDSSALMQANQSAKQHYLPNYIQPVSATQNAKTHEDDPDVSNQRKRDALHNNRSVISTPNEQRIRYQVQKFENWQQQRGRLPSSSDSSNNETSTASAEKLKKPANHIDSKLLDTFERDTEKRLARTGKIHQRCRSRDVSLLSQDQNNLSSSTNQQTDNNIRSDTVQMNSDYVAKPSVAKQAQTTSQNTASTTSRRTRLRKRQPIVSTTEEKYSTMPADFRPGEVPNALIKHERHRKTNRLLDASSNGNCNQEGFSNRNELMITNKQTSVSLEDAETKRHDVEGDIANHSVHNQSLQTNHSSDKSRSATSLRGIADNANSAQNRSKQVESLRSYFTSEQSSKIEFSRAYTKEKGKNREIKQHRVEEIVKPDIEHVSHSQPLRVVKISEDYWPRDEDTERLLMRNSSYNDMQKNVRSDSKQSTKMTGLLEHAPSAQTSHIALITDELLSLPKETNLCDPIDSTVDSFNHDSYYDGGLQSKDDKSFSDFSSKTAHIATQVNEVTDGKRDHVIKKIRPIETKWNYDVIDAKLEADDSNYNSSGGDLSKTQLGCDSQEFIYQETPNNHNYPPVSPSQRKDSIVLSSEALVKNPVAVDTKRSAESLDEGCVSDDAPSSIFGSIPSFSASASKREIIENLFPPSNRRRRKASAVAGQHGSDTSNTSGESNRSLSDPLANRKKSPNSAEEEGPVDSNFQYPLKPKVYKDAHIYQMDDAKSDVSERSDNGSIESDIVENMDTISHEPKNFEEVTPLKGFKSIKKKSFSDPDSKAVLTAGLINKNDFEATSLHGSSSDPNLAEAIDSQGSLARIHSVSRSSHETSLASDRFSKESSNSDIAVITQSIEMLSHSLAEQDLERPASKKFHPKKMLLEMSEVQSENDNFFKPIREGETELPTSSTEQRSPSVDLGKEEEKFNEIYEMMDPKNRKSPEIKKSIHGRSASEPVTDSLNSGRRAKSVSDERIRRPGIVQAPALTDVLHDDGLSPKPVSPSERIAATLPRASAPHGLDYNSFHNRPAPVSFLRCISNFRMKLRKN